MTNVVDVENGPGVAKVKLTEPVDQHDHLGCRGRIGLYRALDAGTDVRLTRVAAGGEGRPNLRVADELVVIGRAG